MTCAMSSTLSPARLDPKALEAAGVWFGRNFNGLPNSAALVNGLISSYLAALPQAEPVAWRFPTNGSWHVTNSREAIAALPPGYTVEPLFASPTPAVSREVAEEMILAGCRVLYPGLFGSGLEARPHDGPATRARMAETVKQVRSILTAALSQPHSEK